MWLRVEKYNIISSICYAAALLDNKVQISLFSSCSVTPRPPSPSIHEFPNPAASVNPQDPNALDAEGEEKSAESKQINK